jgi:5-methylcytosine-specific restriction protein A
MATAPKSRSRKQPETRRFSRGRPYRRARQAWFDSEATNRLCAECLKQGKTTEATELDHIQRAADRPDLFDDPSNWQPLCRECHEAKTARENGVQFPEFSVQETHCDSLKTENRKLKTGAKRP